MGGVVSVHATGGVGIMVQGLWCSLGGVSERMSLPAILLVNGHSRAPESLELLKLVSTQY